MDPNDLKEQGNACMKTGDTKGAIEAYTKAIEADPKNHVFFSNRSAAYLKSGKATDALEDAKECVKLSPDWVKGYARVSQAQMALGELEGALETCQQGLTKEADNTGLLQIVRSVKNKMLFKSLKGSWYGEVHEQIGGYVQVFDFKSESSVTITAVGSTMPCSYILDASAEPINLDIQIRQPSGEQILVRHIAKIEDDKLYMCSPYMVMPEMRPTEFAGPGLVVMHRGVPGLSDEEKREKEVLDGLTLDERTIRFCKEVCDSIPEGTIMGMVEGEPEEVSTQKMTNFVKFQSALQKIKLRYGDEPELFMQQCLVGKATASAEVQAAVQKVRERLMEAGMMERSEAEKASTQPVTPEEPKFTKEDQTEEVPAQVEKKKVEKSEVKEVAVAPKSTVDEPKASDASVPKVVTPTTDSTLPLLLVAAAVIGGIALTAFLMKR